MTHFSACDNADERTEDATPRPEDSREDRTEDKVVKEAGHWVRFEDEDTMDRTFKM